MQLSESYEIFEFTQHEGVIVSKALDKKTRKLIQIHLFPNEKISEATQICARLLSLPGEARSKVLKYGPDGSSTYFITEPLPEGEMLGEWVLREAASRASGRPEVSSGAVGNPGSYDSYNLLRQMEIEPAPLQPLRPGPESRRAPIEQAPSPNPVPPATRPAPRVRPMRPSEGPPEPAASGPSDWTLACTGEQVNTPLQTSPAPQVPPSRSDSQALTDSPMTYSDVYGAKDLIVPEAPDFPETAPEAGNATPEVGPGLDTFIGIRKAVPPSVTTATGAQGGATTSPAPSPTETMPVSFPPGAPPRRVSPPPPIKHERFTFDSPVTRPPVREAAESIFLPPPPLPVPPVPPPVVRQPPASEAARAPAPIFSAWVAAVVALSLIAVAAIVVLIVEFSG